MTPVSDSEIQQIVQRVTRQMVPTAVPAGVKPAPAQPKAPPAQSSAKSVAIGSDHGGFEMKTVLIEVLKESGYMVIDCGTKDKNSVDYPDFAFAVAQHVGEGRAWRGIVVDGAGIGSCMAANKVAGVRAAMCYDYATAVNSREHNDANVLTLGGGLIGMNLAKQIVTTWLATEFGGGRHQGRVDKIMQIEKKYSKAG
jgi:ribose 5-phosphate isomerase B